jgi:putative membrane protein
VAFFGFAVHLWRRFNGNYRMTVSSAPDGLRLESGLVETTAETIRRGRVQAVRLEEPLAWRPLGWCRVAVDVAGRQRDKHENRGEGRQLRDVLPVGTRDDARRLLARIIPGAPAAGSPPPPRARLKALLRFRYLGWGRNDVYAVTTTGRVTKITVWAPLGKVQSLRHVQGPAQRRLRLATIHLDVAGRNTGAAISDRDEDEAQRALDELIELCRAARRAEASGSRRHERLEPRA